MNLIRYLDLVNIIIIIHYLRYLHESGLETLWVVLLVGVSQLLDILFRACLEFRLGSIIILINGMLDCSSTMNYHHRNCHIND